MNKTCRFYLKIFFLVYCCSQRDQTSVTSKTQASPPHRAIQDAGSVCKPPLEKESGAQTLRVGAGRA